MMLIKFYKEIKNKGAEIKIDIRDEPWGNRYFVIEDPTLRLINVNNYTLNRNFSDLTDLKLQLNVKYIAYNRKFSDFCVLKLHYGFC
ncbi:Uncharacterised protein [Chryseobacterium indoltheticum]|uniref:Uncharacterized protein n=1 Tax=Chryseobacterium indoltheticum TaxID=254 RepID=A0A381FHJ3_9FLAO|nr:Uncharacterised protein [Chryseobacterium indoltheticum]